MFEILTGLLALGVVAFIAFPQFFAFSTEKKKVVGSSYWGTYPDTPKEDLPEHTLVAPKPGRKWNMVAGSKMYAGGNGRK